jgi:CheY-like chemotaxis protein
VPYPLKLGIPCRKVLDRQPRRTYKYFYEVPRRRRRSAGPGPTPTAARRASPRREPHPGRNPRSRGEGLVLIVDDSADAREMYSMLLTHAGFRLLTASDGWTGVQAALDIRPDVVVMDFSMPGLDGVSAISILKRDARRRDVPAILLTAYPLDALRKDALDTGAEIVLTKPCLPDERSATFVSLWLADPRQLRRRGGRRQVPEARRLRGLSSSAAKASDVDDVGALLRRAVRGPDRLRTRRADGVGTRSGNEPSERLTASTLAAQVCD